MKLIVKIERKPIYVRSLTGPWHCLRTPGGSQTRCHVWFGSVVPDKVTVYPPEEGFTPPVEERCTRNGCKEEFGVHDALAQIIAAKRAEIAEVTDIFGTVQFTRWHEYDGRAMGCPYCGVTLPDPHHERIENHGGMFDTMTCPVVQPGQIMLVRKGYEPAAR